MSNNHQLHDDDGYDSDVQEFKTGTDYRAIVTFNPPEESEQVLGALVNEDVPSCRSYLSFYIPSHWHSYLRVRFVIKEIEKTGAKVSTSTSKVRVKMSRILLKINARSISHISHEAVTSPIAHLNQTPGLMEAINGGELYRLNVTFDPDCISTESLWTTRQYAEPCQGQVQMLQQACASGRLRLYVQAGEGLKTPFTAFNTRRQAEQLTHPLDIWHADHPRQHFVQLGAILEAEDRPVDVRYPPQQAFSDFGEYVTTMGYAAIGEHEITVARAKAIENEIFLLRILAIPGCSNRRYFALIEIPPTFEWRFEVGDTLAVCLDPEPDIREDDWSATIIESLPFAPMGDVTMLLRRRYIKEEEQYDDFELPAIPSNFSSEDEAKDACTNGATIEVKIRVLVEKKTLARQISAIRQIQDHRPDLHRFLCAKNYCDAEQKDLYATMPADQIHGMLRGLKLTSSQRDTLDYCRRLPNGIGLIQGPPGTGKTHIILEIVTPLLLSSSHQPALILTPTNLTSDDIVHRLSQSNRDRGGSPNNIIIRLHVMSTEFDVVAQSSAGDRLPPTVFGEPSELETIAELDTAKYLYDFYQQVEQRPSIAADKRVRLIDQSLGGWMLRVANIIQHPCNEPGPRWSDFREAYHRYSQEDMDTEQLINFRSRTKDLREYVLSIAKVVVCTLNNAGDAKLYTSFQPVVTLVDEAAKATEPDSIIPLAWNPAGPVVFVGDHMQLRPTILSQQTNHFYGQLRQSLFARLAEGGHPHVMLTEQHRMHPDIANIPSKFWYEGRLISVPSTRNRPMAKVFSHYLQQRFNLKGPTMLLNIPGVARKLGSSLYNLTNAASVLEILVPLLTEVEPGHIAIITPYKAQCHVYKNALYQLGKESGKDLRNIQLRTIDGFQGGEAPIVVLDLTITDRLGFVREPNRLNVAMSRAQDGFIIVTNVSENESIRNRHNKWLMKIISNYKRRHIVSDTRQPNLNTFQTLPSEQPIPSWRTTTDGGQTLQHLSHPRTLPPHLLRLRTLRYRPPRPPSHPPSTS